MSKKIALTPALLEPIMDRAAAEAFMRELVRLNLDHHFDDGAVECLFRNGVITRADAVRIDVQVKFCYDAWAASGADMMHDCPIGYLLDYAKYDEAVARATEMMDTVDMEPTSALKQAASDHEIPFGPRMGSFVKWALSLPIFTGAQA